MDQPLRVKMVGLLILASLLPLAVSAFIDIRETRQNLRSSETALLAARADHLVDQLDIFHRSFQHAVGRLAQLPGVARPWQEPDDRDDAAAQAILNVWVTSDPRIRGVAILDPSGVVKRASEPALVGTSLAYHRYIQEALRGNPVVSDIHVAEAVVADAPTIAYVAPVLGPTGDLIGLAALWVHATALWDIAKAANELAGPGSFAVLFDQQGIRVAHTYSRDIVFHPGGPLDAKTVEALVAERRFGDKTRELLADVRAFPEQFDRARSASPDHGLFYGFAPVNQQWNYGVARRFETVPWTLFYMIPEAFLDAPIEETTRNKAFFAAAIIFLALVAGALLTALILNPIRSLSRATEALASGHLGARVPVGYADELGQLGANFNIMATRIEAQDTALRLAKEDLEERVLERTAELRTSEQNLAALAREAQKELAERRRAESSLSETEEQLRQAQKLESIGQLAGGIAHDFNNLISVILTYAIMLINELKPGDPVRDDLMQIKDAGERATKLTHQLLAFSRKQVMQPRVVEISDIVGGMDKFLRRLIGEDIELVLALRPGLGAVKVDPAQIEQVILNLVINARDAMPSGGQLTIETAPVDLDARYAIEHAGVAPGPYVMLAVSDTGSGMSKEVQSRLFEPFFTTKEPGKGTGLGLSTSYGIVKQSGGHLWVYSEVGKGSAFKIYLPRVAESVLSTESSPPKASSLRGTETVLLVEDEAMVRQLVKGILRRNGYEVLEAANGGEALLLCERHPGVIHLLLTDVVMPMISGRALADRLRTLRPTMRLLFMSGYTDDAVVRHGVLNTGVSFLQKPITPDALLRKVREVLVGDPH
jgi:two-component system cell cycle sensor histidine kinase/response regulator CckA